VDGDARRADPAAATGAADVRCDDRCTHQGPATGAVRRRSASGPGTLGGRSPPSAPRSRSPEAPGRAS